jgi:RNA polymerase sigma-70 factor (sigma-E family)
MTGVATIEWWLDSRRPLCSSIGTPVMPARDAEYADFVRARTHALLRSAYLLTGDRHLAEDLVQEALARTHRSWSRLTDVSNAEAYARRTMYHLQVSIWRRRRVAESLPGTMPETGVDDHAEATARRVAVQRALLTLSARQRAVIVLRFFEDHTEVEAADLLGVSVSTVKTQTGRALARLRPLVPGFLASGLDATITTEVDR